MHPELQILNVELSERGYPIYIGGGSLAKTNLWLQGFNNRKAFIITDDQVGGIYGHRLKQNLQASFSSIEILEIPAGEKSKSFAQYEAVQEWLIENKVTRDSVLFALGGGVIGDLAGFAAATVLRGVDFIQIPTSLLAQVDSSVGGKTGINSKQGKNLIGCFYQPKAVVIDTDVLKTLPQRELQAGYAEILKYGLLGDAGFFAWLEANGQKLLSGDTRALTYAIHKSCAMKADIVRQDEREETGLRALLNLGHTFAHALEAAAGYDGRILHGEAVSIGLNLAARLSRDLGLISDQDAQLVQNHLQRLQLKSEIRDIAPKLSTSAEDLLALMRKDKKATAAGLNFVVLDKIGQAKLQSGVSDVIIFKILKDSM